MKRILLTCLFFGTAGAASAEAPDVPTAAPYIVLSANLDEPNGYGFCIDTYSRGKTDLMQTHSCKPASEGQPRDYQDNDTRFSFNPDTGQVASYAFEEHCMQVLIAAELTVFALLECSDHPRQQFVYDSADQTLRFAEDQALCVSVAAETQTAGPWVKRPLQLNACDDTETSLKEWTVVVE